ncbi:hypothetical protein yberc0001_32820 [Yersinia bercovieri ATCC 43970]|uniref:Uncharacterized protein n=1 Tax=Yersinia bercovieri ATCC 43970 TaxID=349968 RepID=A0ABM9Y1Z2_YERBE|nr:hypothetical protein yberc0001_32820 [Yersinia bercovieri ATCC 43970]
MLRFEAQCSPLTLWGFFYDRLIEPIILFLYNELLPYINLSVLLDVTNR